MCKAGTTESRNKPVLEASVWNGAPRRELMSFVSKISYAEAARGSLQLLFIRMMFLKDRVVSVGS